MHGYDSISKLLTHPSIYLTDLLLRTSVLPGQFGREHGNPELVYPYGFLLMQCIYFDTELFAIDMKQLTNPMLAELLSGHGTPLLSCSFIILTRTCCRGRGLGGSSGINFMVWQKPSANDIDAWEELGSSGWNWERFHAAVKKAETYD